MAIISRETFKKLSKEEKRKIRKQYKEVCDKGRFGFEAKLELESLFDNKDLLAEPVIKTWGDIIEEFPNLNDELMRSTKEIHTFAGLVCSKAIATYKIFTLIEKGYGGTVSLKTWEEDGAWCIIPRRESYGEKFKLEIIHEFQVKHFVAFYNKEDANEFMSYPENVELLNKYYISNGSI